jgi:hypothetical protein
MTDDLFRYIRTATAEAAGKDRADAIRNAFAFMDAHTKYRRRTCAEKFEVTRVRRLGPGWWSVSFRPKRRKTTGVA